MAEKTKAPDDVSALWQRAQQNYFLTANAIGAELCHFMSQRFDAYARIIDDLSHCQDLGEAWRLQSEYGEQMFKVYSDEAAKLGGLMVQATNGGASNSAHYS